MSGFIERVIAFLAELKRRKVYHVVILYCVVAFALIELADITLPVLGAPEGALALVLAVAVAGLPIALLLGWMYDLTQSGIQRDPADREAATRRSRAGRVVTTLIVLATSVGLGWASWSLWHLYGGAPLSAAPAGPPEHDPRRIAVLYLDDHSEEGDLGFLAAGLTESLIHELSSVPGLMVSSRNAVKPFRERPVSIDSMVSILGVGSLVEGSVVRAADRVRATVQLIDGRSGGHISSQVVEGSMDDLFEFQDALADSVARALRRHLGQEIHLRGVRAATESETAWTLYLRGADLLDVLGRREKQLSREEYRAGLLRADSLLAEAEAADPGWVQPELARLGVVTRLASLHGPAPGALDAGWARRGLERASAILRNHPDTPMALQLRGWIWLRLANTPGMEGSQALLDSARADIDRAIEIAPDRAGPWWILSEILIYQERFTEAVDAASRAFDTDVFLDVEESSLHSLFYSTLQLGPLDEAIRWCDEGHRRFPEKANFIRCKLLVLGTFPQVEPDVERAWQLFEDLMTVTPERTRPSWRMFGGSHVAQVLARAGLADSARAVLRAVRGPEPPAMLASHEAKVHLLLGDEDQAVDLLRLYLTHDPDTAYLARDWWFEELRDHPGFRQLVGLIDPPG